MMDTEIFGLVAAVIVGALMSLMLKKNNPEQAFLITLGVSVAVFAVCVPSLSGIVDMLNDLSRNAGLNSAEYLIKALVICLVTQIGSRVCIDYGNSAAAASLETAGKAAVLVISMPVLDELLKMVSELIMK